MPKITAHGGATNKYAPPVAASAVPAALPTEAAEAAPAVVEVARDEEADNIVAVVLAAIEEPAATEEPAVVEPAPVSFAAGGPVPSPAAFVRPRKAVKPGDGG